MVVLELISWERGHLGRFRSRRDACAPRENHTRISVQVLSVLLQMYPLRAYDAIHLACALLVQRQAQQHGVPLPRFVSADATLLTAAAAEGFVVDNPLLHP